MKNKRSESTSMLESSSTEPSSLLSPFILGKPKKPKEMVENDRDLLVSFLGMIPLMSYFEELGYWLCNTIKESMPNKMYTHSNAFY